MREHVIAWETENRNTTWKGPFSIAKIKAELPSGAQVLDAGCGNGKLYDPLVRAGFKVSGIDVSKSALLSMGSRDSLVAGDIIDLPFKDRTFDAVVCHDVLQHLLADERTKAVKNLERSIKHGGVLFLEVFGEKDMRRGGDVVEPRTYKRESGVVYHYFTEDEIKSLLSGFEILWVDSYFTRKIFRGSEHIRHRINAAGRI